MKLLPLLCLLSPWFGPGSAQEIRPGVVTVAEFADALLPCSLSSKQKIEKFDWRKDNGEYEKKEVFFYERGSHYNNGRPGQDEQFKGRVLFFEDELKAGNASIKIKRTRLEDNGTYTCVLFERDRQKFHIIRLNVDCVLTIRNVTGAAPEPYIKPIRQKNNWSLLECKVQGVPKPEVEWRNSAGEVIPTKDEDLHVTESQEGQFLVNLQVYVTKSDNYTCVATQRAIFHQFNNTMEVYIQGAALKPHVSIRHQTNTGALLECQVQGAYPKPEVVWQDSSGNIIPSQKPQVTERGDILLLTTVSTTGHYHCVVTQEDIRHQVSAQTYVITYDALTSTYNTGWIVAGVLGALLSLLALAKLIHALSNARQRKGSVGQPSEQEKCLEDTSSSARPSSQPS